MNKLILLAVSWVEAQRIASKHRRMGQRVHVCQLTGNLHALWPAP